MLMQQSIRVAEKITQKVEGQLSKSQKEFLLRQQVISSILKSAPIFSFNLGSTIFPFFAVNLILRWSSIHQRLSWPNITGNSNSTIRISEGKAGDKMKLTNEKC